MVKLTKSLQHWLFKNHPDLISSIMFGHVELFTEEMQKEYVEWCKTEEGKRYMKVCDLCTNCNNTELQNIKDCKEIDIGYSYAYKTDCAGDRYIKAEEVKYLLKCEINKAIDDFSTDIINKISFEDKWLFDCKSNNADTNIAFSALRTFINERAEQLKAGI